MKVVPGTSLTLPPSLCSLHFASRRVINARPDIHIKLVDRLSLACVQLISIQWSRKQSCVAGATQRRLDIVVYIMKEFLESGNETSPVSLC